MRKTFSYVIIAWGPDITNEASPFRRWPVDSPHRGTVTRKMFPFDDVIMEKHNRIPSVHIWYTVDRSHLMWAEAHIRWLEHRHGWLVKRQWAGSIPGWVSRDEYQVLGSTSIPARLYWEVFSWLTSVGTTRNTVIRFGLSRIGLAVLILHAAGVGLTDRPAVSSGVYNKYHSLQLQNYYAHFPPLQHTHIHAKHNYAELVMGMIMGFEALYAGRGRGNPVWRGPLVIKGIDCKVGRTLWCRL